MATHTTSLIDELARTPGKAEIVRGRIVPMSPTGLLPGLAARQVLLRLTEFERESKLGWALGDNIAFVVDLPHRRSFSPDVAFYTGTFTGMGFCQGPPVFAVEVRSEDYGPAAERRLAEKRADYFAAGTQVVWDVDLLSVDVVRVYRASAPDQPTIHRRGDQAEAEPAVPGWTMPVDDLFPHAPPHPTVPTPAS